jgi:hypothetical protein
MTEWIVAALFVFTAVGVVAAAFFALRVVRVRGGARQSWHLLIASPRHLNLSQYAPKAVELSNSFRRWGYFALASLAIAVIARTVVEH